VPVNGLENVGSLLPISATLQELLQQRLVFQLRAGELRHFIVEFLVPLSLAQTVFNAQPNRPT
jgi:hypothetical protein